jgi:hypothetical protein
MMSKFVILKGSAPRAALGLALSLALLGGCVVYGRAPVPGVYVGAVAVPPPAPQVEVIGVPPQPGYVWIGGYWDWVGGRHVWAPGYWAAPRPGYRWVPHRWAYGGGGWRLHQGYWARH